MTLFDPTFNLNEELATLENYVFIVVMVRRTSTLTGTKKKISALSL